MRATDTPIVTVWEDTGLTIMARILGNAGTPITKASLTGITCKIWDRKSGANVATPTVTINDAVYDTLQTADPRWTKDDTGYNFLHVIPASALSLPNKRYRAGYKFDPVTEEDFAMAVDIQTKQFQA